MAEKRTHFARGCEVAMAWQGHIPLTCDRPSVYRYPAMHGGWMHLCEWHGKKHERISEHVSGAVGDILAESRKDPPRVVPQKRVPRSSGGRGWSPERRAEMSRRMSERWRRQKYGEPTAEPAAPRPAPDGEGRGDDAE